MKWTDFIFGITNKQSEPWSGEYQAFMVFPGEQVLITSREDKETAITEMKRFISQAEEALRRLEDSE